MSTAGGLTAGSLCTGFGGLSMAVRDALGAKPLWCSEYEPPSEKAPQPTQAAARILAHHYPNLPNLGDMQAVDWSRQDEVDVTEAGYPCPGESAAGKRLGMDDPRWMWPAYFRLIREMRPKLAIGENVRGHLTKSFRYVVSDLQSIGYTVVWTVLAASSVGACHKRERLFWAAYGQDAGTPAGLGSTPIAELIDGDWAMPAIFGPAIRFPRLPPAGSAYGGAIFSSTAYSHDRFSGTLFPTPRTTDVFGAGRHGDGGLDLRTAISLLPTPTATPYGNNQSPSIGAAVRPSLESLAAAGQLLPTPTARDSKGGVKPLGRIRPDGRVRGDGDRSLPDAIQPEQWGQYALAVSRWEGLSRPAPSPTELAPKGGVRLDARFVEWMMDAPAGWIVDVPGITRNEALRAGGNGVVRRQGAAAVEHLARRIPATVLGISRHAA